MHPHALMLASTMIYRMRLDETPYEEHPFPSDVETVVAADELTEFAARTRNQSWDRPNPATRTNKAYLAEVIRRGQTSVMAHASASVYLTGISRDFVHRLYAAGGRDLNVSEMEPRYVDSSMMGAVCPPMSAEDDDVTYDLNEFMRQARDFYRSTYGYHKGALEYAEDEAREAAYAFMPTSVETEALVTGTLRAWRDVVNALIASHNSEDEAVGRLILFELRTVAPNCFQDVDKVTPLQAVIDASDSVPVPDEPPLPVWWKFIPGCECEFCASHPARHAMNSTT